MPTRKMRVELDDNEGNRYAITFEGQVTREKALRLLELVELLGGIPTSDGSTSLQLEQARNGGSKYSKASTLIGKYFPLAWFSSRELQSVYEQEFKQPISLSTVATYLARMVTRHLVIKTGPSNNLRYKLALAAPGITVASQSFSQST